MSKQKAEKASAYFKLKNKKIKNNSSDNFFPQGYGSKDFSIDIIAGIIAALVSIPISMGYSQISGLPMIYGLYGSLIPILLFGFITTSHDFIFGVDAAPAALTGAAVTALGFAPESKDAATVIPMISLMTAAWLLLFSLIKAGNIIKYISMPVMSGFITGICTEIILMQVPKLYGGKSGSGEAPELIIHIFKSLRFFNLAGFLLSASTIFIILILKKFIPKFPMSIFVMVIGAIITYAFNLKNYGVTLLPPVKSGLPTFKFPVLTNDIIHPSLIFTSLTVSLVIIAESLLSSRKNALADGYDLNSNREIFAYAVGNFVSSLTGCCPVNGSVSRTSIVRQLGARSQIISISAFISMIFILLFGTRFIQYLPVPVLTGVVICALLGACEFNLAKKLAHTSRFDLIIFWAAFLGVLILGTIYGVIIGVILSFAAVVANAVTPPRHFEGIIPGRRGFHNLDRNKNAYPIKDTVIYRFNGNLFFANIDTFQSDIENSITPTTKRVIVNASGIGNIDITAADRLMILTQNLKKRGIRLFLTEHVEKVNDSLRLYGADELIKTGSVRRTIETALRASGIKEPYEIENHDTISNKTKDETDDARLLGIKAELDWAFGEDADHMRKEIVENIISTLMDDSITDIKDALLQAERDTPWGRLAYLDEDDILQRAETHIPEFAAAQNMSERYFEDLIEARRKIIEERINSRNSDSVKKLHAQRLRYIESLKRMDENLYETYLNIRKEYGDED